MVDEMESKPGSFVFNSLLGGFFCSIGSLFGKFSSSYDELSLWKILLFILMVSFNTIGMVNCVKALNISSSSLTATLCSSASIYVFTAVLGLVILGESVPFIWWCGTVSIISGLLIISYQDTRVKKHSS